MHILHQHHVEQADICELYYGLQSAPLHYLAKARQYLLSQLQQTAPQRATLPDNPADLENHIASNSARTAKNYRDYLLTRQQGQPRRYFSNRAHALYFLHNVAATKLVDGAWLYGVLSRWHDLRMHDLIRTYLEELGDGEPEQNHVFIYKQLLAALDLQDLKSLPADRFIQGTLQLALGHLSNEFLPEVIGYNLGYEQLPLHLMITTYELAELGIDPHYFRLHITIDNASTGHAYRAARAVLDNLPADGQYQAFYRRVKQGYQLNELGPSTMQIIDNFSLNNELCKVLEVKSSIAKHMHSDYCRIGGRSVNDWLTSKGQIAEMLEALQHQGWIRRHQNPVDSRFWQLIQSSRAPMFGVFSRYELQLMYDWIAGEWQCEQPAFSSKRYGIERCDTVSMTAIDKKQEEITLQKQLNKLPPEKRFRYLVDLMAPSCHFTPEGLAATRFFFQKICLGHNQLSARAINTR